MGEVDRPAVLRTVRASNPRASEQDLAIWVDLYVTYREAADNIGANGAIVLHPRTAAPMENPYLKIRDATAKSLRAMTRIRSPDALWRAN